MSEDTLLYNRKELLKKRDRLGAISETMDAVVTEARVASIRRDIDKLTVLRGIAEQYLQALDNELALLRQTKSQGNNHENNSD